MGFAISLVKHYSFDLSLLHLLSSLVYASVDFAHLCYNVGLSNLESINLSFTVVTDSGLRKLSGLTSLRTLNLDARHVTDAGLSALTSKSIQCFSLQSSSCMFLKSKC